MIKGSDKSYDPRLWARRVTYAELGPKLKPVTRTKAFGITASNEEYQRQYQKQYYRNRLN